MGYILSTTTWQEIRSEEIEAIGKDLTVLLGLIERIAEEY